MKINYKVPKILFAAVIVASLAFYASSCKKGSAVTSAATVTEADAAEVTTDALVPSSGGMSTQLTSSVDIYKKVKLTCGVEKDSSILVASLAGATPAYSYALNWNYVLSCNGLLPSVLTFNFTGSGSYDGPRLSTTDKSTGGFVMTGFAASQYAVTATFNRSGSATSKIARQYTFTHNLTVKSTNIVIDKTSEEIVSGTATVSFTATSTSGKTFTYNGTLTFLGGKKATLVLNSGATYNISWA